MWLNPDPIPNPIEQHKQEKIKLSHSTIEWSLRACLDCLFESVAEPGLYPTKKSTTTKIIVIISQAPNTSLPHQIEQLFHIQNNYYTAIKHSIWGRRKNLYRSQWNMNYNNTNSTWQHQQFISKKQIKISQIKIFQKPKTYKNIEICLSLSNSYQNFITWKVNACFQLISQKNIFWIEIKETYFMIKIENPI
jgi:hypothetical protein